MKTEMRVSLLDHTPDPFKTLWVGFRTCYSDKTPQELWRIAEEEMDREKIVRFVVERAAVGHVSPWYFVWFTFGVAGVSRTFSHQFVRHHVGISFLQQSGRYLKYDGEDYLYVVPPSVERSGLSEGYQGLRKEEGRFYQKALDSGVPQEDARFGMPEGIATNLLVIVNMAELLYIASERLCTRAQWEFRRVVSLMRAEVLRKFPELGILLQPKCGERRLGYCNELYRDWIRCPIGKIRPHKSQIIPVSGERMTLEFVGRELTEEDFVEIAKVEDLSALPERDAES